MSSAPVWLKRLGFGQLAVDRKEGTLLVELHHAPPFANSSRSARRSSRSFSSAASMERRRSRIRRTSPFFGALHRSTEPEVGGSSPPGSATFVATRFSCTSADHLTESKRTRSSFFELGRLGTLVVEEPRGLMPGESAASPAQAPASLRTRVATVQGPIGLDVVFRCALSSRCPGHACACSAGLPKLRIRQGQRSGEPPRST